MRLFGQLAELTKVVLRLSAGGQVQVDSASSQATGTQTAHIPDLPTAGTDTFTMLALSQTLTNKVLTGNTAATLISGSGTLTLNTSGTVTVPNGTDTLVNLTGPQTLSNKGINGANNSLVVRAASDISGILPPANGGTGVANNAASTLTISGNFPTTLTVSNTTALTLPTSGTLATLAGAETLTNKVINGASNTLTVRAASDITGILGAANGGTGIANNAASTLTISGNFATTLTVSNTTAVTLPTAGTLATLAGTETLTNKTLTSPAVTNLSGTLVNITGLGLRDTSAAFDVTLAATSSTTLTAGRTLTIDMQNAAVTVKAGPLSRFSTLTDGAAGTVLSTLGTNTGYSWVSVLSNPLTTTGDTLYSSNNSGSPARLGIGSTGQVYTVTSGLPAWSNTIAAPTTVSANSGSDTFTVTAPGSGNGANLVVSAGNGTTSTQAAYLELRALQTSPQTWRVGLNSSTQFSIRDITNPADMVLIPAGGAKGVRLFGVTDGSAQTAGYVGQQVEATQTTSTNAGTSGQYFDAVSISLTAGVWLMNYLFVGILNGSVTTVMSGGIGTATGNSSSGLTYGTTQTDSVPPTAAANTSIVIPGYYVNITSTTTYYGKGFFTYSAGTPQYRARLTAIRVV